jgi:hypothetical protein
MAAPALALIPPVIIAVRVNAIGVYLASRTSRTR